jgi:O-antigen/teichoic acid export membrane protein
MKTAEVRDHDPADHDPAERTTVLSSEAQAVSRGGTALLVFQTVARALGLLFVVVVTRHLGPEQFARYSVAASLVLMGNLFADVGTTPAMMKLVSRKPEHSDRLLSGTLGASFALGVVSAGAVAAFAALGNYRDPVVVDILIAALGIPAASVATSIAGALDGRGLIARRAAVTLLQSVVIGIGGLGAVLAGAGARGAVVALAAAPWVALVVSAAVARRAGIWRTRPTPDMARTRQLLRASLPFAAIMSCSAFSSRFDVVLLSLTASPADTAVYDLAQRLMESLWYISAAVTAPALVILSRRLGADDVDGARRAFREAARVLYVIALPVAVVLVVVARPAVDLVLGSGYGDAVVPFAILAGGVWVVFVVQVQVALVNAADNTRAAVAMAAAVAAVTVALDLVLVPLLGPAGAAWAMVASWTVAALAYGRLARRQLGIATPLPPMPVLVSTAVMSVAVIALRTVPVAAVLVGGAVYVGALVVTGGVQRRDVDRLRVIARLGPPPVAQ